jgi:NAD(P)-dependent dehydrogenase (short-subunit alcohol dehydrogenase family)
MPTVLITGTSRGIGLEFARQYAAEGWRVLATCRDPNKAKAMKALGVEAHRLDVGDGAAIAALGRALEGTPIDVLLSNAGLWFRGGERFGALDYDAWGTSFRVNAIATARLAEAFAGNLAAAAEKKLVAISSRLGSLALMQSGYLYASTKAALNAIVKGLAHDLKDRGIIVIAMTPGWVRTDMGGADAALSVEQSIAGMRRVIAGLRPADTGGFFAHDGAAVPY